jgi:hypothetical protein
MNMQRTANRMPDVQWGENTDYDTLLSVLFGWIVEVHMTDGEVIAGEVISSCGSVICESDVALAPWDDDKGIADKENAIPIDLDRVERIIVQ